MVWQFPVIFLGETKIGDDKRKSLHEAFNWLNDFLANGSYVAGGQAPTVADIFTLASISSVVVSRISSQNRTPNVMSACNNGLLE